MEKLSTDFDIPDGGYGWVNVAVMGASNFCCWGGNAGFSVYLAHYLKTNTFGGSELDYAAIGGLSFGSGILFAPVITALVGLASPNAVLFAGAVIAVVAMVCASFTKQIWQLYLSQGVLMGVGLSLIATPVPWVISQWFRKKRSLAMGAGAAGSGVGGIVFSLAMQRIMERYSVEWALRAQAIIYFAVLSVCALLLKPRSKIKPVFTAYDAEVLSNPGFWLYCLWVLLIMFGYVSVQYCLADATSQLGYSASKGSITSAVMNVGVIFGRPLMGFLADKVGSITIGVVIYAACGLLCLILWSLASSLGAMYTLSILMGALMGYVWGGSGSILPRLVGLKKTPVAFGLSWVVIGSSGIVAPIIALALRFTKSNGEKSYLHVAIFSGCSFMACAVVLFVLRGYVVAKDQKCSGDSDQGDELRVPVTLREVACGCVQWGPKLV